MVMVLSPKKTAAKPAAKSAPKAAPKTEPAQPKESSV
jgi:hypothetical protein